MPDDTDRDFVKESLALAAEPYKTIIKRRLDGGEFGAFVAPLQERFSLTEDQLDTVTLIAFRAACDPDSLETAKDQLIAEADLSYEHAVKIQRSIAQDVVLPIKAEGDAILAATAPDRLQAGQRRTADGPPAPSGVLFDDHKARVTNRTITLGGATHPAGSLTKVVGPYLVPHMGFIGDLFEWGYWFVALTFVHGEERSIHWSTREEASRFAQAIKTVMSK